MNMDCIFCKIINNEIPSYTLYEDDIVKVFMDVNPVTDGHCLVVPKKHYVDLVDIDDDTLLHIFKTARNIKKLLENKLDIKGVTLCQNNGISEEVKHYHLHMIPNYDNFDLATCINNRTKNNAEDIYKKIMD